MPWSRSTPLPGYLNDETACRRDVPRDRAQDRRCRKVTAEEDAQDAPLSVLGLTLRAYNALMNNGIGTVGDLLARSEVELARLPEVGPIILADIKVKLTARGLALRTGVSSGD